MVTGLWKKTEVYCNMHDELVKMELTEKNGVVFYECLLGKCENSTNGASLCKNTLSLKDFEKMLDYISKIMCEAILNNEEPNLKNTEFTIGKIKYKIFEHKDFIKVIATDLRVGKRV